MKKTSSFSLFFCFLLITAFGQSEKDVISASEITWFGLDFTKAIFVGSFNQFAEAGETGGQDLKNKYIPGWNDLVINERQKYNLKEAYKKSSVLYEPEIVNKRNGTIDASKMVTLNAAEGRIKKEDIAKVVSQYKSGKKGIGLVYIVETYSKADERGVIWVTFFDMATRKVLITEKFSGKPGGFGLRNYWAKPVFEIMMKSSAAAYKNWETQYK
jgi:hypothetical protein